MKVELLALTLPLGHGNPSRTTPGDDTAPTLHTSEDLIGYCARVSSPQNQSTDPTRLLDYCRRKGHWSVFTMANAILSITTTRDIARQFTRHESLQVIESTPTPIIQHDGFDKHAGGIQEFSQRYAKAALITDRPARMQHPTNRQSSLPVTNPSLSEWWDDEVASMVAHAGETYFAALDNGIAKEVARVLLPEGLTESHLYVNGTLRSWMHYLATRLSTGTQQEHQNLATLIYHALQPHFPNVLLSTIDDFRGAFCTDH